MAVFFFIVVAAALYATERSLRMPFVESLPLGALFLLAISVLISAAFRALWPVYVGPEGVRAPDGVGRYQEAPWATMRTVTTWPGFLIVRHGGFGTGLCVPLFLDDAALFRSYILEHAPEDNPLRVYFESR